jgi:hypothetical protein
MWYSHQLQQMGIPTLTDHLPAFGEDPGRISALKGFMSFRIRKIRNKSWHLIRPYLNSLKIFLRRNVKINLQSASNFNKNKLVTQTSRHYTSGNICTYHVMQRYKQKCLVSVTHVCWNNLYLTSYCPVHNELIRINSPHPDVYIKKYTRYAGEYKVEKTIISELFRQTPGLDLKSNAVEAHHNTQKKNLSNNHNYPKIRY